MACAAQRRAGKIGACARGVHLLAHDRLLHGCERLERREQRNSMLTATHKFDKVAELLGECKEHFVLVVDGLCARTREAGA